MDSNTLSAFAAVLSVVAVLRDRRDHLPPGQARAAWSGPRTSPPGSASRCCRRPTTCRAGSTTSRKQDFLGRFLTAGEASQQERDYAVRNTCYLFGQYLSWVEIIRRESQYIDPRSRENNRLIVEKLEHVRDRMADSERVDDRPLRLFRGEQRAVGELMLVPVPTPTGDVPRWECLGYATFVDRLTGPQVRHVVRTARGRDRDTGQGGAGASRRGSPSCSTP